MEGPTRTSHARPSDAERASYRSVVSAAEEVLDQLSAVVPDQAVLVSCRANLAVVNAALAVLPHLPENPHVPAHSPENPRFQPGERGLVPWLDVDEEDDHHLVGRVTFRPRFGGTASVHGGAVGLFLDDLMGRVANGAMIGMIARTAYLHIDYRSLTPVDVEVHCESWIERLEGRKRFIRSVLRREDLVLVEANGLWVAPSPPQVIA